MPSGWDVYYVVFLSALLALAIPVSLKIISTLVGGRPKGSDPQSGTKSNGAHTKPFAIAAGRQVNPRFFLGANFALGMVALALVLIPCVVTVADHSDLVAARGAWVGVLTLAGFAGLGLIYAYRKGDLNWLRSFSGEHSEKYQDPGGGE